MLKAVLILHKSTIFHVIFPAAVLEPKKRIKKKENAPHQLAVS